MQDQIVVLVRTVIHLAIWLALLAGIFVPLERFFALRTLRRSARATAFELGLYFLNGLLPALVLGTAGAVLAAAVQALVPDWWRESVAGLPLAFRLMASLVAAEIGAYWGHRLSHRLPLLWRFHRLHHAAEALTWLANTRAHPLDIIFERLCGLTVVYALGLAHATAGAPDIVPVLITLFGLVWGFFVHANIRWRFGWLEHVVATPHFHHWHHTASGPIDRNFAPLFPWIDRLFGTLHGPRNAWPERYGVADGAPPGIAAE